MKRLTMLVTSEGRWVLEDSAEFLAELGDPHPDYDAALFAVLRDVSRIPAVRAAYQRLSALGVRLLGAVVIGE